MHAIRHYVVLLVGTAVLAWFTGPAPALWVLAAIVGSWRVNRVTSVIAAVDRRHSFASAGFWIAAFTFGSVGLALLCAVLVFIAFGWIAALGMVVLYVLYLGTEETEWAAARRKVVRVRRSLRDSVMEWSAARLTEDRLVPRANLVLSAGLPELAFSDREVCAPLFGSDAVTPAQLLRLAWSRGEPRVQSGQYPPRCELHEAVLAELGTSGRA